LILIVVFIARQPAAATEGAGKLGRSKLGLGKVDLGKLFFGKVGRQFCAGR